MGMHTVALEIKKKKRKKRKKKKKIEQKKDIRRYVFSIYKGYGVQTADAGRAACKAR
jgi:hypothetical protein